MVHHSGQKVDIRVRVHSLNFDLIELRNIYESRKEDLASRE